MHPTRLGRCPTETASVSRGVNASKWDNRAWEMKRRFGGQRCPRSSTTRRHLMECGVVSVDRAGVEEVASTSVGQPFLSSNDVGSSEKPRIVVLGSGWGAVSFIKALKRQTCDKYDIVLISPRNYFLYTPLLPAVATGTLEERSIVEPIRNIIHGKGRYFEAKCTSIDPQNRSLEACYVSENGAGEESFRIQYDMLVVAVGAVTNAFGVEGVREHCFFFKTVEDAHRLRVHLTECFEKAALPQTTQEEREKLLSFVIVGGGPTGVEVAAELHDVMSEDLARLYPELMPSVSIRLIDNADHVLTAYDRRLSDYTQKEFVSDGIDLALNTRVNKVQPGALTVAERNGKGTVLKHVPFGTCVWATGIATNPLITMMQNVLPEQDHGRAILTDGYLRVKGSMGTIWSLGDAATIEQHQAREHADELFSSMDADNDGKISKKELKNMFDEMKQQFPQFEEFARFSNINSFWYRITELVKKEEGRLDDTFRESFVKALYEDAQNVFNSIVDKDLMSMEDFAALLQEIDDRMRRLPATAQVARQQGEYLASLLNSADVCHATDLEGLVEPFQYHHKGQLAYVGEDKAVIDIPQLGLLFGVFAGLIWKSFETYSQISLRSQILVALDWMKTKIFGRDISRL